MDKTVPEKRLKCPLCRNYIAGDSQICEYCGGVVVYDHQAHGLYASAKICFRCGVENERGASYCCGCNNTFTVVCPKCKNEIELQQGYCKRCGLRIDQFHVVEGVNRRSRAARVSRSKRIGYYIGGGLLLPFALFFSVLAVDSLCTGSSISRTVGFAFGAICFILLVALIAKILFEARKDP